MRSTIQSLADQLLAGDLAAALPLLDMLGEQNDPRRDALNMLVGELLHTMQRIDQNVRTGVETRAGKGWAFRSAWRTFHRGASILLLPLGGFSLIEFREMAARMREIVGEENAADNP